MGYWYQPMWAMVIERCGKAATTGSSMLASSKPCTGAVTASSDWDGPTERKLVRPALAGSYEALFHEVGLPRFLLDLRERDVAKALGDAPLIDHLWLGVGANGHTLSLFPGRRLDSSRLVVPVRDAPDPPPERISLTLAALQHVRRCVVLAAGADKHDVVRRGLDGDTTLPIGEATQVILRGGGEVTWIIDDAAGLGA